MWKKKILAVLTAAAMAGSTIQPVMAQGYDRNDNGYYDRDYDQSNDRYYDNDRDRYERDRDRYEQDRGRYEAQRRAAARWDRVAWYRECERQRAGNTAGGAIVGGVIGGLLGNAISRGPQRGAGTAVGAILGGVVGASVGRNLSCEDRSYEIDTYYRGFEAGRPHARYDWRSPRGGTYGYIRVGDYYRERGHRCATYTQEIWVHGRPETASGHACRQPDGTWQLVS